MAVYKVVADGVTYSWIEKGARACLVVGTRLLWMGDPCDPASLRRLAAPLAVLLELSVLRGLDRS